VRVNDCAARWSRLELRGSAARAMVRTEGDRGSLDHRRDGERPEGRRRHVRRTQLLEIGGSAGL